MTPCARKREASGLRGRPPSVPFSREVRAFVSLRCVATRAAGPTMSTPCCGGDARHADWCIRAAVEVRLSAAVFGVQDDRIGIVVRHLPRAGCRCRGARRMAAPVRIGLRRILRPSTCESHRPRTRRDRNPIAKLGFGNVSNGWSESMGSIPARRSPQQHTASC